MRAFKGETQLFTHPIKNIQSDKTYDMKKFDNTAISIVEEKHLT